MNIKYPIEYLREGSNITQIEKMTSFVLKGNEYSLWRSKLIKLDEVTVYDIWYKGPNNEWLILNQPFVRGYEYEEVVLMRASDYYLNLRDQLFGAISE